MHAAKIDGREMRNSFARRRQSFVGRVTTKQGWRKRNAAKKGRKGLKVTKKNKSVWHSLNWPKCPNNEKHGGMSPDENGGWFCQACKSAHTSRSRDAYRWSVSHVYACYPEEREEKKEEPK